MRRLVIIAAIATVVMPTAEAQQGAKFASAPKEDLILDSNWEPIPGDRIETLREETPACSGTHLYDRMLASLKANDHDGMKDGIVKLPKGTLLLVIRGFRPETPRGGVRTMSTEAYLRQIQNMQAAPDYSDSPVEVRVLEGPGKGSVRMVPESYLALRTKPPEPHGYTVVDGPSPIDRRFFELPAVPQGDRRSKPELRAANLYQLGTKAERRGDAGGAIACFHRLVTDYPELLEGKNAALHLEAMGASQLKDGNYLLDPSARNPKRKPTAPVAESTTDPSKRAASLLVMAKNLEKLKKADAALKAYKELAEKYPDTVAAKEAAERAKALMQLKSK